MPWTNRGQYCAYCTSYLSSGNLSRHLETCARFDGRFSVDRAKEALELEQKHKAKYTKKYVLSRSEVYEILGEFVGHKFTTSMSQEILEKAGHRLIDAAGVLDPTDITSLQETEVYSREGKLLHADVDGTFTDSERSSRAGKRLFQTTTEEQNLNEIGAKVRKEDAKQKPSIINGNSSVEDTQYAPLFASMKLIVGRYASLNENAGDVTRFQRPCEKDFRDVTAYAFQSHYAFLSNMYPCVIEFEGDIYHSSEHLYTAMMARHHDRLDLIPDIIKARDGYDAKHIAKRIKIDDSWEEAKVKVMKTVISLKFDQNDNLRDRLLNLKGFLYEATKGDTFSCGIVLSQLSDISKTTSQEKTFLEKSSANTETISLQKNKSAMSP